MELRDMKVLCDLLVEQTEGLDKYPMFCAEHDIIYIPVFEKDVLYADQLEELGCHWDSDVGSWAVYC